MFISPTCSAAELRPLACSDFCRWEAPLLSRAQVAAAPATASAQHSSAASAAEAQSALQAFLKMFSITVGFPPCERARGSAAFHQKLPGQLIHAAATTLTFGKQSYNTNASHAACCHSNEPRLPKCVRYHAMRACLLFHIDAGHCRRGRSAGSCCGLNHAFHSGGDRLLGDHGGENVGYEVCDDDSSGRLAR